VITVRLAAGRPAPDHPPVHLGVRAIDGSDPGDVIVVDSSRHVGVGSWGGLLSKAARRAGVAGVVTDGECRDVDESRLLGFPVFGRGGTVRTARGRIHEASTGEPITVGGVAVASGDYVIADGSGVVFVPAERLGQVLEVARGLVDRETELLRRLAAGESLPSVLGVSYESMLEEAVDDDDRR
jgi:regulator of RNase E activity RraA